MSRQTTTLVSCNRCKAEIKAEGENHEDFAVFSIRDNYDFNIKGDLCEMCKIEFQVWYREVARREKATDYKQ